MSRLSQILKFRKNKSWIAISKSELFGNSQKKAICYSILTVSPKKPNSANRRIIKVKITSFDKPTVAKVNGEGLNNLQQHSTVLLKGVKVKDLIGVHLTPIRGKFDLMGVTNRKTERSVYGVVKH